MNNKVVYFPSCINQTMGLAKDSPVDQPLVKQMLSLLQKAGYEVIFPPKMEKLCCGTIWESKGMLDIADSKSTELEAALWEASEQGRYPVLCDQSPCLHRMRATIQKIKLYEPAEFIYTFLRDKLEFTPTDRPIAIHITCSMRKMGLANILISLGKALLNPSIHSGRDRLLWFCRRQRIHAAGTQHLCFTQAASAIDESRYRYRLLK